MTTAIETRSDVFGEDYAEVLRTLSEGSVNLHFDPYEDIDWDSPEFAIDPHDPAWVLSPELDPLGATEWYRSLPLERQIEIGRWRMANAIRVGSAFESVLIRGLMHYAITRPNGSPEFRYCLHEMTEECNHIQMFQELVNRIGVDVPGMRPFFRAVAPLAGFLGGYAHAILMIGILAGEEPIDHYQKELLRSGRPVPRAVLRVMEIHIAEEARHISFAGEFLRAHRPRMSRLTSTVCALAFPITMRWLGGEIMTSPRRMQKEFDIPEEVWRDAFWRAPKSRQIMASYFNDMRALATELGWMTPLARRLWKRCGIDGEASRYRGEPDRTARAAA
jgi:hypothetical protein